MVIENVFSLLFKPFRKRVRTKGFIFLGCWFFVSLIFATNPIGLSHPYGNNNGKYIDAGDSFSEYLIRNQIIDNYSNPERFYIGGYYNAEKYGKNEYEYTSDEPSYYYTMPLLQVLPLTAIASFLKGFGISFQTIFAIFRAFNACALAFCLIYVVDFLASSITGLRDNFYPSISCILLPFVFGLTIFSQNLYFFTSLFWLPGVALCYCLKNNLPSRSVLLLSVISFTISFLRGYEFAMLPLGFVLVILFTNKRNTERQINILSIIGAWLFAFILSHLIHASIIIGLGHASSITEAFELKFASFTSRVLTLFYVPFSPEFMNYFQGLFRSTFIRINGAFSIDHYQFLVVYNFLLVLLLAKSHENSTRRQILIMGLSPYLIVLSCYLSAYQHLMSHAFMYSWFIFSSAFMVQFLVMASVFAERITSKRIKFFSIASNIQ